MNEDVLVTYFMCSDSIHNVYCGGLFERHYVDARYSDTHIHTVIWIYIYFLLFQGLNLLQPVLSFPLELPLLLSVCSFGCLKRDPGYRCPHTPFPKSRQQKVFLVAEFALQDRAREGGRGVG